MRRRTLIPLLSVAVAGFLAQGWALSGTPVSETIAGPGSRFSLAKPPGMMGRAKTSDQCVLIPIAIGDTVQGNLDASCSHPPPNDYHVAYYVLPDGLAGQGLTMTVTYSDPALTPVLVEFLNYHTGEILAYNCGREPRSPCPSRSRRRTSTCWAWPRAMRASAATSRSPSSRRPGADALRDETTLCLGGQRFQVQVDWDSGNGETGHGQARMLTDTTGYYWFFDPTNIEMVVKVVDGCSVNDQQWVFAAGLTNVRVTLRVTDTQTERNEDVRERREHAVRAAPGHVGIRSCDAAAMTDSRRPGRGREPAEIEPSWPLVVAILGLLAQGCATIISGPNQKVPVFTNPPGATVTAGSQRIVSPGVLEAAPERRRRPR